MPDGSSSDAPVIRPGPRIFRNRFAGLGSRASAFFGLAASPTDAGRGIVRDLSWSRSLRADGPRPEVGLLLFIFGHQESGLRTLCRRSIARSVSKNVRRSSTDSASLHLRAMWSASTAASAVAGT
jgi:hypothetical protein